MSSGKSFRFRQTNHSALLFRQISGFLKQGRFLDVSLMSNGHVIRCHRLVLSAFSPYLAQIISNQPAADLVIHFEEIEFRELEALVAFMYHGDVTVRCDKVELFARAADKLKIVGLAGTIGTHIADLLHREGIVGDPGLGSSSELHLQQEKSQNVEKKCKMPDACTIEQQQGKRTADLDPQQVTFKRLMECSEITFQNQKRPTVTATGSQSTTVKIPPAVTKTSQSTSGSATVIHFSGGGTCIPAGIQDKGLDLSAKNLKASTNITIAGKKGVASRSKVKTLESPIPISEQMEKAARYGGQPNRGDSETCEKYGVSVNDVDAYLMRQLDLLQPQ